MISSIDDVQRLVLEGFTNWQEYGHVSVGEKNDLLIFNYTQQVQYSAVWTPLEQMSRGLIINRITGEVVARPFDKFWNWLEGGRKASGHIISVTEKIDGSLGILYRYDGEYCIATRGSFDGPQAAWATEFLQENYDLSNLPDEYTLLFEIIYPDNRIVVDYGSREDLVLLAVRNRFTGEYLPHFPAVAEIAFEYGFSLPSVYAFNNIDAIVSLTGKIDANQEGWVVEFSDGSRWKIKGDRYLELHKLICGLSFNRVLEAVQSGTIETLKEMLPDEFVAQVDIWELEIRERVQDIRMQVYQYFSAALKHRNNRKDFALWVGKNCKHLAPYMFAMLDGKFSDDLIYKRAFK